MTKLKLGVAVVLAALLAGIPAADVQAKPAMAQADPGSSVALLILKEIGIGAAQGVGTQGLAQALSLMGIGGDPGTAAQLASIQQSLERVNTQLTSLRNETAAISQAVTESNYNNAARDALPILNAVDHAEAKLKSAAAQPTGSTDQKTLAAEARAYIGANLLDKGTQLATYFSGSGPFVPDSILSAAWKVRTQDNFLSPSDSVQLRYLVDYYTSYEAALTQLVSGYYRSSPGYPLSEIQRIVDQTDSTIANQLNQRRDAVPDGTVVDVRTGLMWSTSSTIPVTMNPGGDTAAATYGGSVGAWFLANPTLKVQPDGLGGWVFPTKDQMLGLINGWNGQPSSWLMKNAGFPAPLIAGAGSERNWEFWTSTPRGVFSRFLGARAEVISYDVVNMLGGELAFRMWGGSTNQHGYIPVRVTPPGSYLR
jgi:hypothetical protein